MIKSSAILFLTCVLTASVASAHGIAPVGLDSIDFERHGEYMVLDMKMDLADTKVGSSNAQIITPMIVSENMDTVMELQSIGIYGRLRYLIHERNGNKPLEGNDTKIFKVADRPQSVDYNFSVPFQDWMANSQLMIRRSLYGCSECLIDKKVDPITSYFEPDPEIPEIVYFNTTDMIVKIDTLEGSAFVDFPVDQTIIYPEYRNNVRELGKIQASIDTVYNDQDVTITGVWLKGFASPESPYSHNTDLAIGRTAALKKYIGQLYHFNDEIIATDYEPEDWEGLRKAVDKSNIDHKAEILELIDSDLEPDLKEATIKKRYPVEYKFMLQNFYPPLRHTDYKITYEIDRFDDLTKIREVFRTKPKHLSLEELFILANSYPPDSQEWNDVYETAVRLYPNDPTANINAANAAIQRQDLKSAEQYLSKAGDSPEALYAKGSLAFIKGEYDLAKDLMLQALPTTPQAQSTLDEIEAIKANSAEKKVKKIILQ